MKTVREYKLITQSFANPLITSKDVWRERSSVVLREQSIDGDVFYGEIAPVRNFPQQASISSILREAESWMNFSNASNLKTIMPALSCMNSEIWEMKYEEQKEILPCQIFDLKNPLPKSRTIKRKIGLLPLREEIEIITKWISGLNSNVKVRLDPNGAFSVSDLLNWIEAFANEPKLEFIEQPLPVEQLDEIMAIAEESNVPLALDESIIEMGGPQRLFDMGWRGFYVLKPTLLSDWEEMLDFVRKWKDLCVFSSVFESPFGYEALLRTCIYSDTDPGISRNIFMGNAIELESHHLSRLKVPAARMEQLEALWHTI